MNDVNDVQCFCRFSNRRTVCSPLVWDGDGQVYRWRKEKPVCQFARGHRGDLLPSVPSSLTESLPSGWTRGLRFLLEIRPAVSLSAVR